MQYLVATDQQDRHIRGLLAFFENLDPPIDGNARVDNHMQKRQRKFIK